MADSNNILRPIPQRVWQITPASSDPPSPASPTDDANSAQEAEKDSSTISPSRTRSILNLTSSTLFGIYSPSGPDGASAGGGTFSQANTPWGTGAMTPAISTAASSPRMDFEEQQTSSPTVGSFERLPIPQMAHHPRKQPLLTGTIIPLAGRSTLLFVCGLVYGVMVTYLHDNETLAPVRLEGVHRNTWQYLCFWGGLSVILGNMLPWLDELLEEEPMADKQLSGQRSNRARKESTASRRTLIVEEPDRSDGRDWFSAVRGIGVFIGIAFAIVCPFPPKPFQAYEEICKANTSTPTAKIALGIPIASHPHPRPRQSGAVVRPRPLAARLRCLDSRRVCRDTGVHGAEPQDHTTNRVRHIFYESITA